MNIKSEKEFYGEELKRVALRFNADIFVWGEELISRKLIIYPKKLKDVIGYEEVKENLEPYKLGGWEFLDIANKLFDNEKQVDWGSYAYQCTKEQLAKLMEQTGCEIDKINELASEKIYGIVFVEEV